MKSEKDPEKSCPSCEGTGRVWDSDENDDDIETDCPRCQGTGLDVDGE